MSELADRLQADLVAAMKEHDELTRSTLRMAIASIKNEQVAGKQARELSDDDVVAVLTRELKKRKEAATAYSDAGQPQRAEAELAEAAVLEEYLPAQLDDAEVTELVAGAIAELGVSGPGAMGQVMKAVRPATAGRVDGGRLAAEVKRQLGA